MTYDLDVLQSVQLWTQTTMYTQKLLVHNRGQGQGAEGVHACVVDLFRVFVFTFEFEGEIVCQVTAFVISSQKEQRVRVPDLERPEVQDALD